MLNFMNRLGLYKQRSILLCEVSILSLQGLYTLQLVPFDHGGLQGSEYQVGDFVLRVCRAILKPGDEVRGLLLDIEYMTTQDMQELQQALKERL